MKIAMCESESGDAYLFRCDSSIPDSEFKQKIRTAADWEIKDDPNFGKTSYIHVNIIREVSIIPDVTNVVPDYSIKSL